MISCELNGKKYTMDFVSGRVLREMDDVLKAYAAITKSTEAKKNGDEEYKEEMTVAEAMDALVKWFCLLFGNQFTPDDVYDYYPADSITYDITFAVMAVQNRMSSVLSEFPMKPTETKEQTKK